MSKEETLLEEMTNLAEISLSIFLVFVKIYV